MEIILLCQELNVYKKCNNRIAQIDVSDVGETQNLLYIDPIFRNI